MSTRETVQYTPPVETDPRFKSCRYRGFYMQGGLRSAQEMCLSFVEGVVTGWGADPVGRFSVAGTYEVDSGRARWCKHYPGRHTVQYDVTAEVKNGLWGLWQILGSLGDRGGFQLWPVDGLAAGQERELEADLPVEAVEKVEAEVAAGMA